MGSTAGATVLSVATPRRPSSLAPRRGPRIGTRPPSNPQQGPRIPRRRVSASDRPGSGGRGMAQGGRRPRGGSGLDECGAELGAALLEQLDEVADRQPFAAVWGQPSELAASIPQGRLDRLEITHEGMMAVSATRLERPTGSASATRKDGPGGAGRDQVRSPKRSTRTMGTEVVCDVDLAEVSPTGRWHWCRPTHSSRQIQAGRHPGVARTLAYAGAQGPAGARFPPARPPPVLTSPLRRPRGPARSPIWRGLGAPPRRPSAPAWASCRRRPHHGPCRAMSHSADRLTAPRRHG